MGKSLAVLSHFSSQEKLPDTQLCPVASVFFQRNKNKQTLYIYIYTERERKRERERERE